MMMIRPAAVAHGSHWQSPPKQLTGKGRQSGRAAAAFEELLTDQLWVLGPDHPDTLTTPQQPSHPAVKAGDPERAAAAEEELLADRHRVLPIETRPSRSG